MIPPRGRKGATRTLHRERESRPLPPSRRSESAEYRSGFAPIRIRIAFFFCYAGSELQKNCPWEPEFAFWGTRQSARGAGGFNSQNQPKRISDAFGVISANPLRGYAGSELQKNAPVTKPLRGYAG